MRSSAHSKFPWLVPAVIALAMLTASAASAQTPEAPAPWSTAGFMIGCREYEGMTAGAVKEPVSFDTAFGAGFCLGVVQAAAATLPEGAACLPEGKDTGDLIAAINKVVEQYREGLALDRSTPTSVAIQALVVAYPCKN